jgi:hypothetical protein
MAGRRLEAVDGDQSERKTRDWRELEERRTRNSRKRETERERGGEEGERERDKRIERERER